jgi:hypothetical protein
MAVPSNLLAAWRAARRRARPSYVEDKIGNCAAAST